MLPGAVSQAPYRTEGLFMPEEDTVPQILAAEGIADSVQDLRQLSATELRRLFAFASSGKINATRVIKNSDSAGFYVWCRRPPRDAESSRFWSQLSWYRLWLRRWAGL
jgi:hypothetical protein